MDGDAESVAGSARESTPSDGQAASGMGVRGRLLLAFLGISAFAVLAAAAALYSFFRADEALERIADRRVPAAIASLEISRQADRLVIAAPGLLDADTVEAHFDLSSELNDEADRLRDMLEQLKEQVSESTAVEDLDNGVDWLSLTVINLSTLVGTRITVTERVTELAWEVREHLASTTNFVANTQRRQEQAMPNGAPNLRAMQALESLAALERIRLQLGSIGDLLGHGIGARESSQIQELRERMNALVEQMALDAQSLNWGSQIGMEEAIGVLRRQIAGEGGLLVLRRRELAIGADGVRLLQESAAASGRVTEAVDRLVAEVNDDIRAAAAAAQGIQTRITWLLAVAVGLSLLCSALIVWLYVGRNLVRRLKRLSDSMLALAAGDLRVELPAPAGGDEIARMASALHVFRDTAAEVEKANEREVQSARSRLTHAIENISEGFALFDAEDRIVLCNRRYRESMYPGLEEAAVAGTPFESIVRAAAARGLVAAAVGREEEWLSERMEMHRNPGAPHLQRGRDDRWIRVSERRTDDGGTVAVYTDITELKEREEEAAAATEAKSRFLANMSHELRTPLNAVIGITEMLEEDIGERGPPEYGEPLHRIHRAGNHLLHLINEILDLSKIEAGKLEVRPESVDLDALLKDVVETASPLAARNGNRVELSIDIPVGHIWADPMRLRQIALNLLSNAAKFTERGLVTVRAARRDLNGQQWLEIRVTDTGIGMTPDEVERLFREFTQLDSSVSRRHGGSGLGLAICRRLCNMLGGSIEVESEPGVGSTFIVLLPAEDNAQRRGSG